MKTNNQLKEDKERNVLSVYDFDGTLSYNDSFMPFLKFSFGSIPYFLKLTSLLFPAFKYLFGKITRSDLKSLLIKRFLSGVSEKWLIEKADEYCNLNFNILVRYKAVSQINSYQEDGINMVICSASPEILLSPFAERLNVDLIGTRLEVKKGILTGNIIGKNCIAYEKVSRLKNKFGDLSNYHLIGWGDSPGDYDFLSISQEANWRPFRSFSPATPNFINAIKIRNSKNY